MSTSFASAYTLFDGALLHGTEEASGLIRHEHCVALYDELGEQASSVGPLLLPLDSHVDRLLRRLLEKGRPERYACSQLTCAQGPDALVAHLRDLRLVRTGSGAEYYFRYADGRALDSVWRVLMPAQQVAILGPILSWSYIGPSGQTQQLRVVQPHPDESATTLPLHLSPPQWHAALEQTRIGELFEATAKLAQAADPPCVGSAQERRAWTAKTYELLARSGIARPDVRTMANLVMWQSGGRLAEDSVFKLDLRDCERPDGVERLRRYERAHQDVRRYR